MSELRCPVSELRCPVSELTCPEFELFVEQRELAFVAFAFGRPICAFAADSGRAQPHCED